MGKAIGYYFGTEINEKWWKRYTKDNLFARGTGEYWFDKKGVYFLRFLTVKPIFIPYDSITEIKTGKWHSGRWGQGHMVIKILWVKDSIKLSSGFILSKDKKKAQEILSELQKSIVALSQNT